MEKALLSTLVSYTRIDPIAAATHETRRALLARLRDAGAQRIGTLARDLGADYKNTLYHARVLAEAELVVLWRERHARWCRLRGAPQLPDERFCRKATLDEACPCSRCAP